MDLSLPGLGQAASQYMTKEVMSVLIGLAFLYVGFKGAAKSWGFVAGTMKKISFMGAVATCMLFGGLGATGLSVGEIWSRPSKAQIAEAGLSNKELINLALHKNANEIEIREILEYVRARDAAAPRKVKSPEDMQVFFRLDNSDPASPKIVPISKTMGGYSVGDQIEKIQVDPVKDAALKAEESVMSIPSAFTVMGLGIASIIGSLFVYGNGNRAWNTADPHYNRA